MTTKRSNEDSKRTIKKIRYQKPKHHPQKLLQRHSQMRWPMRLTSARQRRPRKILGLQLNWNRAIHIDTTIDETLLKTLTPRILKLKQESTDPITIGIDSPGGSISAMQSLLALLRAPDQDGNRIEIYTVSTNRAYSAAASMLAFGDYSVAFPHSQILYHDVRYSGVEDLTPSKALRTARELEKGNVEFSLKLANHVRRRLLWVYLDL